MRIGVCLRICLAVAAGLTGCSEFNDRAAPLPAEGEELPILNQVAGTFSHEDRPMRLVIRDQALLSQVPLVDIPVDFRTQMLLVVTLGRRLSDEYQVQINRVWRDGPVLRVDYETRGPTADTPVVVSSPYCMAVVPRCDLNVDGFSATLPGRRPRIPDILQEQRDLPEGQRGTSNPGLNRARRGSGNVRPS
jgi:hypothetical protein